MRLGRSAEQKKRKSLGPSPTMELDLQSLPEIAPLGIFKRDVRGGFEVNPKEIPLSPLILRAMDRREHEKERASLQR